MFFKNQSPDIPKKEEKSHGLWARLSRRTTPTQGPQPGSIFSAVMASLSKSSAWGAGGSAMDDANGVNPVKMLATAPERISPALADWYASQSFIGYQLSALISQHWLVNKACTMPARDATRNGYSIVTTGGDPIPEETLKTLQRYDKKFRIRWNAEQFVRMGRIFGVRIALFDVQSTDPEYYEKPFNPDGVTRGSYRGISQVDPYWCTPLVVGDEMADPASQNFYEPTYWLIGGKKYHRSHLMIFRNADVPDMLKPAYMYGGVPVPQLIMERVYGAERSATEAPLLVQSKRTSVWLTDMEAFMTNEDSARRMAEWIQRRDNHGIKMGDKDADQFQQFDTALSDLDSVIMTQYQLVAAAAGVPASKLLQTTPKGFNSTGEFESKSYHEELESIQEHDLTDLVERHHLLVQLSYCDDVTETSIVWKPTDSPTAQELAARNQLKVATFATLVQAGAIDGQEVRRLLAKDPDFGMDDLGSGQDDDDMMGLGFEGESLDAARALGILPGPEEATHGEE